jgi:hypothetical protein
MASFMKVPQKGLPRARALQKWLHLYPELFATRLHHDCFLEIAFLTQSSDTLPSLKVLYESLPYAENSVRAYLRALANGGWISFIDSEPSDRRCKGVRIEARFKEVRQEYLLRLERDADEAQEGDAHAVPRLPSSDAVSQ